MNTHYNNRLTKMIDWCRSKYPYTKDKPLGYHNHHIIPRSWGGSNNPDNLVTIPPRVHYLLHMLLSKAHPADDRMAYAWLMMYNTASTSKLYEKHRTVCEETIRLSFGRGDRISARAGQVMAKHVVTGEQRLVSKSVFDCDTDWVGISAGITRTDEFKAAVSQRSKNMPRSQNQRDAARQNIAQLKVDVTCVCCHVTRSLPNHVKHIKGISPNRGKERSQAQKDAMLLGKQSKEQQHGTLKKTYIITVDGIDYMCWDIVQLATQAGISAPTCRKRYQARFLGVYNRNGVTVQPLPSHALGLQWFIEPPAHMPQSNL